MEGRLDVARLVLYNFEPNTWWEKLAYASRRAFTLLMTSIVFAPDCRRT